MKLKSHIPNLLTACNLLCGCVGIVLVAHGSLHIAPVAVMLAAAFDFLDGLAARIMQVTSQIGKELDSLADVVSFGVLPSITVYELLRIGQGNSLLPFVAFLIAVFSAFRLAIFNVDTRQSEKFIGLPTPANAIFFTTLVWAGEKYPQVTSHWVLVALVILFSWLLVAPIELIALKFKNYTWAGNRPRYLIIFLSLLLLVAGYAWLPLIIPLYVLVSVFYRPTTVGK